MTHDGSYLLVGIFTMYRKVNENNIFLAGTKVFMQRSKNLGIFSL